MADSIPPWRKNSSILGGGREPALSDQGETIIGIYLLLLGEERRGEERRGEERRGEEESQP
ncbi:hypothetical protein D4764_06G0007300 [Takifugu flavidus]|uniref:Uncharacterized protein n=1 Tax=Takifugu flavidus TaxID=433684 RepID=A0A5C6N0E9_9TELE|nr:hypothetical protein D4764_06G0007300 [Takifugu flavidus]